MIPHFYMNAAYVVFGWLRKGRLVGWITETKYPIVYKKWDWVNFPAEKFWRRT